MDIDGILNIDKPQGITSAAVVRRLKHASKAKRVGHGGTLDPLATGVLPICFGQGTRVAQYLLDYQKEYEAIESECSALVDRDTFREIWAAAVEDQPYSFLFIRLAAKSLNETFMVRFESYITFE